MNAERPIGRKTEREIQLHSRHIFITRNILNLLNCRSSFAAIALFNLQILGRNHYRTYWKRNLTEPFQTCHIPCRGHPSRTVSELKKNTITLSVIRDGFCKKNWKSWIVQLGLTYNKVFNDFFPKIFELNNSAMIGKLDLQIKKLSLGFVINIYLAYICMSLCLSPYKSLGFKLQVGRPKKLSSAKDVWVTLKWQFL